MRRSDRLVYWSQSRSRFRFYFIVGQRSIPILVVFYAWSYLCLDFFVGSYYTLLIPALLFCWPWSSFLYVAAALFSSSFGCVVVETLGGLGGWLIPLFGVVLFLVLGCMLSFLVVVVLMLIVDFLVWSFFLWCAIVYRLSREWHSLPCASRILFSSSC